jgi:DMSO reductase family type II enzyme chaperone
MHDERNLKHTTLRGEGYALLAACFYPPEREVLLREGVIEQLGHALSYVCTSAVSSSRKMGEALHVYSSEELSVEYAKLFLGPFRLKVPPYGSVYIDEGRRVMGDSTMDVISMYRESGLSIREDFKELPDHVGVELEFMSFLAFKEVESQQESRISQVVDFGRKQKDFLDRFLCRWVPAFCNQLGQGSENDFYTSLAECVESFLNCEIRYFSLLPSEGHSISAKEV